MLLRKKSLFKNAYSKIHTEYHKESDYNKCNYQNIFKILILYINEINDLDHFTVYIFMLYCVQQQCQALKLDVLGLHSE